MQGLRSSHSSMISHPFLFGTLDSPPEWPQQPARSNTLTWEPEKEILGRAVSFCTILSPQSSVGKLSSRPSAEDLLKSTLLSPLPLLLSPAALFQTGEWIESWSRCFRFASHPQVSIDPQSSSVFSPLTFHPLSPPLLFPSKTGCCGESF